MRRTAAGVLAAPALAAPAQAQRVTFDEVAPIFAARCAKCHAPNGLMGAAPEGYVLSSYAATLASDDRARVVPGSAAASELVPRIRGQALPRMRLDGPPCLSGQEVALITDWVNQGPFGSEGQCAGVPMSPARRRQHRSGARAVRTVAQ